MAAGSGSGAYNGGGEHAPVLGLPALDLGGEGQKLTPAQPLSDTSLEQLRAIAVNDDPTLHASRPERWQQTEQTQRHQHPEPEPLDPKREPEPLNPKRDPTPEPQTRTSRTWVGQAGTRRQ
eukprot:3517909-Rhodomonas_salina.1